MITPLSEYPLAAEVFDIWASVRKRILALTLDIGGNKSKAWWSQQLPLTPEWDPCYLSDLHSFIFGDLEPHGKLPHSWVTNTVSPLTCSIWYNLFAAQTFGLFYVSPSPLLYQFSPAYKISICRMESSKMEAAFTIHFLFSIYLICQALKFGKLHFRTELKIQYCTLYRRK